MVGLAPVRLEVAVTVREAVVAGVEDTGAVLAVLGGVDVVAP